MKEIKIVYIAHPISGDVEGNINKVLQICKDIHSEDIMPFAPYITTLQYLDDNKTEDRKLGMAYNDTLIHSGIIDEIWVYGDKMSEGIKHEIKIAKELNIPVKFKNARTK